LAAAIAVKDQPGLLGGAALEPGHAHGIDDDVARHVFAQRPAHHLAAEQVDHHGQKEPALVGGDVGNIARPDLVRLAYGELPIEQIGRDRQVVVAVGRDLESTLAASADAVKLHELLHPVLADPDAACEQLFPDPRPAVAAARFGMDHLDVNQQRIVAQMASLEGLGAAHEMLVVARHAGLQHTALHRDRPQAPMSLDEGVLQLCAFAKYAVAFPRMSRSIFTRASSARSLLISICSALTGLLSTPLSLPCRCALTQLNSVWSTTPSVLAAAARLWPPSTSRTASCLNSSV